jgi:hypothetical protein
MRMEKSGFSRIGLLVAAFVRSRTSWRRDAAELARNVTEDNI